MTEMAADLDRITAERIRDEFTKLLCGADPVTGLRLLVDTGLADRFLPELAGLQAGDRRARPAQGRLRAHPHGRQQRGRAARTAAATSCCGMAALLHDIGKPATKAVGPDGRVSFHHHEVVGARMTKARMKAMRYPKDVIAQVADAGRAAPALLRVRPGRVDRLGGAPLRHRRR